MTPSEIVTALKAKCPDAPRWWEALSEDDRQVLSDALEAIFLPVLEAR